MKKHYFKLFLFLTVATNSVAQITQITDLHTGLFDSNPENLFVFNDELIFTAAPDNSGRQLFTYNASTDTSTLIPVTTSYGTATMITFSEHIVYNGELYLSLHDNNRGTFFFKYDSATKSLVWFPEMDVKEMVLYDGKIYMSARVNSFSGFGYELYSYSSNTNTFELVRDIYHSSFSAYSYDSTPIGLTVFQNKLYFSASTILTGRELYEYDASLDYLRVRDIANGQEDSSPYGFTIYNDELYFTAFNTTVGQELFKYEPISGLVTVVADINPGTFISNPKELFVFNNKLYFAAYSGLNFGIEFHRYDAQTGISEMVREILPSQQGGNPRNFFVHENRLFFEADSQVGGAGFYVYNDVTDVLTELAIPGTTRMSITDTVIYNNELFFGGFADDYIDGYELYTYTNNVISLVDEGLPGFNSTKPEFLTVYDNAIYFNGENSTSGSELFKYTAPSLGTKEVNQELGVKYYNNALHINDISNSHNTKIYNLLGQFVLESTATIVSTETLQSGIYIAHVKKGNSIKTLKFAK